MHSGSSYWEQYEYECGGGSEPRDRPLRGIALALAMAMKPDIARPTRVITRRDGSVSDV